MDDGTASAECDRFRASNGRRRFLTALGVVASGSIAGCIGPLAGPGEDASDDGEDAGLDPVRFVADHPVDERVPVTDEHNCAVCRMPVADYPAWRGQLAHESATGVFFDTPGCLFAYYAVPEGFDGPDADVARAWITEYETGDTIDAYEAFFALERKGDGAAEPMHPNPRPFADEADALAYVEDAADLSASDVIRFEDVDEDVARLYRDARMP